MVSKARSRLKLFDDTDGYAEGLIEALAVVHANSVDWFNASHQGWLRSWRRRVQPDLGIYFLGENLIATTHTALPVMGITLDQLKSYGPQEMESLGQRLVPYAEEIGGYLAELSAFLALFGKHIQLEPDELPLDEFRLTHNDFVAVKVYGAISKAFRPREERYVGPVIMAVAQINAALYLFPKLLSPDSNLLLRVRLLTAYHAGHTLTKAVPHLMSSMSGFTEDERSYMESRELRNVCAHYGLRRSGVYAIGQTDPFGAVIHGLVGATRAELTSFLERWLIAVSALLEEPLSKARLAHHSAPFGDHS